MSLIHFITHPEVVIYPEVPVPQWTLSNTGIDRMNQFVAKLWIRTVSGIYCSTERKAIDGAQIISEQLRLSFTQIEELGENDRSSTGFLPVEAFEIMATRFFNNPTQSIEGWERAIDAQARIVRAIKSLTNEDSTEGDIAIVSHGGVGTLLLCYLSRSAIDRSMDQPGGGGGNYFSFDRESLKLIHGWRPFENAPAD